MPHKYVLLGAGVAILTAMPVVGHAQQTITISASPSGAIIVNGGTAMAGPMSADKAKTNSAGISADSLVKLNKFVKDSQPILIIDEKITPIKGMAALKAAQIGSVEMKEASDGDLKYYGDKAKHGIMTITTQAAAKGGASKDGRTTTNGRVIVVPSGGQGTFTIQGGP